MTETLTATLPADVLAELSSIMLAPLGDAWLLTLPPAPPVYWSGPGYVAPSVLEPRTLPAGDPCRTIHPIDWRA